jgi:5'-deoxynucleotidase YfbR-like HD superfamily hydrolase
LVAILAPFYSVAQHSVYVSQQCDPDDALAGLLHDASEAYLSDIVRPVKFTAEMEGYRAIEKRLENAIAEKFGLAAAMTPSIKAADDLVLLSEAYALFRPVPDGFTVVYVRITTPTFPRW